MSKVFGLLHLLADGQFHSGDALGDALGLSRSGIWKVINKLAKDYGVNCHKVKGRGYAVYGGIELLEKTKIQSALSPDAMKYVSHIDILPTIDSTNAYLLGKISGGTPSGVACFAEHQSLGRGRLGRAWFSPFGCNIYLSVLWRFPQDVTALQGLTLSMAVAVVRALKAYGLVGIEVKWPNDIFYQGKKLAGILVEMQAVAHVESCVVVGVGLNVSMSDVAHDTILQPFIDVAKIMGHQPNRNRLSGLLLGAIIDVLADFNTTPFLQVKKEWESLDMFYNKRITLNVAEKTVNGIAKGIDDVGALRVEINGHQRTFHSGDVTLKK